MAEISHADEEIVALLKEKDIRGMHMLYNKYGPALYGAIYRFVPVPETAEELLQETLIQSWQQVKTYQPKYGLLYSWLLQTARKLAMEKASAIDVTDKSKIQPVTIKKITLPEDEDAEFDPENIGLSEVTAMLRREQKELLDLIFFNGSTQAEAAAKLRMPMGTVKTRVRNVILELRKLFQLA